MKKINTDTDGILNPSIPDHLSVDATNKYFDPVTAKKIDVFFDGVRQPGNVIEYCISQGWVMRYKTNKFGLPIVKRNPKPTYSPRPQQILKEIETVYGAVEVKWRDNV